LSKKGAKLKLIRTGDNMNQITIKKLIDGSGLKGLKLLTDPNHENNKINNVNIIDNPESYDWFTAGDFLLTTGYIFKDDVESQKRLVKELSDLNCAGLGIKIKRYWNKVPDIIMEEAKKRNFAIVEIPYNYSLSQITRVINDEILKREDSMLKKYKIIHDSFMQASLAGGNLSEIVRISSSLIANPIIVLDSDFNLLAYQDISDNKQPLEIFLNLELRSKIFSKEFTDQIPRDVDNFTLSIKRKFIKNKNEIICRIIPIAYSRLIYGYIIVWETVHKLEAIDYVALENAASNAALERIKAKQIEEAKTRQKEDFFADLIDGKIMSVNAARNLAKIHGMNPLKNHLVLAITTEGNDDFLQKFNEIGLIATNYFEIKNLVLNKFINENKLLLVLELNSNNSKNNITDKIKLIIRDFDLSIKSTSSKYIYRIGVSNICIDFSSIGQTTKEAIKANTIGASLAKEERVNYYDDLIVYNLISAGNDEENIISFFQTNLGELYKLDKTTGTDYLKTLEVYFSANCNISLAAKQAFVHRNTFIYRIEKIKELLKNNLKNAEQNFNYQFALKAFKIIESKIQKL
jgi:PucR family transcriptional regulator, purine catabolism regulatory protein